jgi:thermolysin
VKKILTLIGILCVGLFAFGLISKRSQAQRRIFSKASQDEKELAQQISREVLRQRGTGRQRGNPDEFKVKRVEIDELNMAHTHYQQVVDGVPVWQGETIVHLKPDGSLSDVTEDAKESVAINTSPNFSTDDAVRFAKQMYRGSSHLTAEPTADLWIFRGEDRDHLAYRIQMRREDNTKDTAMPVIFIDAHTGEKIYEYNNLQTGTGPSLYSGTVTVGTTVSGSTYYLENTTRKVGTFDFRNTTSSVYRFTDTNDVWDSSTQRAAVDAQYGAEKTMGYYQSVHGRNGIDGSGGPAYYSSAVGAVGLISSIVHYSSGYNNAFWNGSYMTYGDGDGSNFSPLVTLDICGHEMTHGVTERTANLTFAGESGALNESTSVVFGAMVERYTRGVTNSNTWKIGEDAYTPGIAGDALRRMDDPHAIGDPDHYSLRLYPGSCTPSDTNDNCGVHTNSSIANHAFYLIAAGGTNRVSGVTVSGVGPDNAAKIWYRALTFYMTSGTNFSGARTATLNAAADLFGSTSTQYNSVATGWCAVGIGACPGTNPSPTPTPTPSGGGELLSNGGFEGSASPWVGSGTGYFYTANGNYPHGGTGYIYFGVNNSVSGQAYQQVAIPSTATGTLTFWLNVTSSETTTTTQYDKLFVEVRDTAGNLLATPATYSNLNKGTAGSYSQKSLNLSAYRGRTVRVQFRSTTDSSVTTSFRIDDVSLK